MMQSIEDKIIDRVLKESLFSAPSTLANRLGHGEETIGGGRRFAYVNFDASTRSAIIYVGDHKFMPAGMTLEIGHQGI